MSWVLRVIVNLNQWQAGWMCCTVPWFLACSVLYRILSVPWDQVVYLPVVVNVQSYWDLQEDPLKPDHANVFVSINNQQINNSYCNTLSTKIIFVHYIDKDDLLTKFGVCGMSPPLERWFQRKNMTSQFIHELLCKINTRKLWNITFTIIPIGL